MTDQRAAEVLVEVARELDRLGFAPASTGNVSVRLSDGLLAITPSGVPYSRLRPEHIVVVDIDGRPIVGDLEPSSDTPVHVAVYRARPDVDSVLHCHSPLATTLACLGLPLPPVHYMMASLSPDGHVGVAPYAIYGSDALGSNAAAELGKDRMACLLANHGVVCVGASPERALANAVTLDWAAGVYQRALVLNDKPPLLRPSEVTEVARKLSTYGATNRTRLASPDGHVHPKEEESR